MIALIVACLYMIVGGSVVRTLGAVRGFEPPALAAAYAFLTVGVLTYLIAHEGGHRAAGAMMGWKCVRFGIGPFEFYRERDRWKRERVKMLWGAFVRQLPPSFAHYRRQKALTLASGALSSLVFGGAFAAIALITSNATVFALFSKLALLTLLGVFELIPACRNGIGSDGYRLLQVLRGGENLDELYRDSVAEASNFTPVRYRDWPREVLARMAAQNDSYNIYLAYMQTLDAGDMEAASQYMRRLIPLMPDARSYPYFAYEAAYWFATYAGDPETARRFLDRAPADARNVVYLQAEAAIASAEGQAERVADLVKRGFALLHDPPVTGSDQCDAERLQRLLSSVCQPILAAAGVEPPSPSRCNDALQA